MLFIIDLWYGQISNDLHLLHSRNCVKFFADLELRVDAHSKNKN